MAERVSTALIEIHDALRQRGFEREVVGVGRAIYTGVMKNGLPAIPIFLSVQDLDFVNLPLIGIKPAWEEAPRLLPHILGPGRAICYYAKGTVVLDRYNPAGTVLQCLERAEKVVRDALGGKLDSDFAAEFRSYWLGSWMLVDLPKDYVGPAEVYYVRLSDTEKTTPVLATEKSWLLNRQQSRWRSAETEPMTVISVDVALTPDPDKNWPPENYAALIEWLGWLAPNLPGAIEEVIAGGDLAFCSLAIRAPNGVFAVRMDVPHHLRTKEFLVNRRTALPREMTRISDRIVIERIEGAAADLDYVYSRNMTSGSIGLAGKRILQIGCGTIGGFLAQQLAQSGAGTAGGKFTLVDTDDLRPENLGRHLLGVPHLNRNKAEACAEFLNAMLPGAKVESLDQDGLSVRIDDFDLVIDATGEESLSIALNEREVVARPSGPQHLYVWLIGNGAAAQAILTGEQEKACYKCLKVDLAGPSRFHGLRPDVNVEVGAIRECGDADFLPFPVSRSVAAAALACDIAIDWSNGKPGNRFRSRTMDERQAYKAADASPVPSAKCPACGHLH